MAEMIVGAVVLSFLCFLLIMFAAYVSGGRR
jgi:hypothetical protein